MRERLVHFLFENCYPILSSALAPISSVQSLSELWTQIGWIYFFSIFNAYPLRYFSNNFFHAQILGLYIIKYRIFSSCFINLSNLFPSFLFLPPLFSFFSFFFIREKDNIITIVEKNLFL